MEKNETPTDRLLVELHRATAAFAEGAVWEGYARVIGGQGATEYYERAEECFNRGYLHLSDAVGFASQRMGGDEVPEVVEFPTARAQARTLPGPGPGFLGPI